LVLAKEKFNVMAAGGAGLGKSTFLKSLFQTLEIPVVRADGKPDDDVCLFWISK